MGMVRLLQVNGSIRNSNSGVFCYFTCDFDSTSYFSYSQTKHSYNMLTHISLTRGIQLGGLCMYLE